MMKRIQLSAEIPDTLAGRRLDQALAELFPDYSRSRLQQWTRAGQVRVDGRSGQVKERVVGGEQVEVDAQLEAEVAPAPQPIPLTIVYEDDALLVIDKPVGLVVHPAAGNRDGTLQNALLHHDPGLVAVPRAGLVHRLDKDTSGVLVVARTLTAHKRLVEQLQARAFQREYQAVVWGVLTAGGTVDAPIGRHPVDRKRMAVVAGGKPAVTHYRVAERFRAHSRLRVHLETGRTHQIRVHMASVRYPLVGDPLYGGRLRIPAGATEALAQALRGFRRQALHAARLGLIHPLTGEAMEWCSPLPADMVGLLEVLRADAQAAEEEAAGP
ncbi:MAG TPA: 23S rRNA pseudouridine(1911/1915/1917) synthase RluD [Gammaproteobacteria bacterium]|nr:23S rRNA pseudouridine(1911/1915/1917) synthase RluD [Gammaproteobacteria bacterium]